MTDRHPSWDDPALYPPETAVGLGGWLRVACRGVPLALLVFGCLALLLLVRLVERPIHGLHRPWTPFITQFVCRNAFRVLGIGFTTQGRRMDRRGAVVANHGSWMDIFALNAAWDAALLGAELSALGDDGFDLGLAGFSESEIDALLAGEDAYDPGIDYRETFSIIVECESEADQARTYEALTAAGYACKVLVN